MSRTQTAPTAPNYIEVRNGGIFGVVYICVGGPEHGRTLTLDAYDAYVGVGVPVVRVAA